MRTPGFTATESVSSAPRGSADHTRRVSLDFEPAVVPAQIDWAKVSSLLSSPDEPRFLWEDRPACPPGQRAVWVYRLPDWGRCYDERTGTLYWCRTEGFVGWECQSALRAVP